MRTPSSLTSLSLTTLLLFGPGCDLARESGIMSCGTWDGHLTWAPDLDPAQAWERCGASYDSYAYLADRETLLVHFRPLTRDQALNRAFDELDLEITLPTGLTAGTLLERPRGRLARRDASSPSAVVGTLTQGTVRVEDVKLRDGIPVEIGLAWDLRFGVEAEGSSWLHTVGRDRLAISARFCEQASRAP